MFYPCKIYDKNGNLKEIISSDKNSDDYWKKVNSLERFAEGNQQNISYAMRCDYIPSTDMPITRNHHRKMVDKAFKHTKDSIR